MHVTPVAYQANTYEYFDSTWQQLSSTLHLCTYVLHQGLPQYGREKMSELIVETAPRA